MKVDILYEETQITVFWPYPDPKIAKIQPQKVQNTLNWVNIKMRQFVENESLQSE